MLVIFESSKAMSIKNMVFRRMTPSSRTYRRYGRFSIYVILYTWFCNILAGCSFALCIVLTSIYNMPYKYVFLIVSLTSSVNLKIADVSRAKVHRISTRLLSPFVCLEAVGFVFHALPKLVKTSFIFIVAPRISLSHLISTPTNAHTYFFFYIKTFKIAPTCFDPKIIFRELHCSLLKPRFWKHSLINFLILMWCCDSISYCVCRMLLKVRLTMGVSCVTLRESHAK